MLRGLASDGFELVRQWVTAEHRRSLLELLAVGDVANVSRGAGGEAYAARGLNRSIPLLAEALRHAQVESLAERLLGVPAVLVDATFFDKHAAANGRFHAIRIEWSPRRMLMCQVREYVAARPTARLWLNRSVAWLSFGFISTRPMSAPRFSCFWESPVGIVPDGKLRELTPDQFKTVDANPGDVLVMRPLTVHRSPSGSAPAHRRVLHVVYGDANLARELGWESVLHS